MEIGLIGTFWAVSLLFVLTPGADWAYAISSGIRHAGVAPAVGGLLAGHVVATVAVAAGLAAAMANVPVLVSMITTLGAAYLMWLGVGTFRSAAHDVLPDDGTTASASRMRQAFTGFAVSGLNPKVFLLFLALLPQFTDPLSSWPLSVQLLCLGLVHVASCAVVYTAIAICARRALGRRPTAARVVSRFSGIAMMTIGAFLLVEQATLWTNATADAQSPSLSIAAIAKANIRPASAANTATASAI